MSRFCFMSRRSQPHLIEIPDVESPHRVTSQKWREMISSGLVTAKRLPDGRASRRIAQLNVGAFLFIYTSWIAIDRNAPVIRGEFYMRELLRQYSCREMPDANVCDRWAQFEGPGGETVTI